jgi:mannitol-1-phosphate 5-dehydrogenase
MADHVFVGFGFGPIQSGLFAKEAYESGSFKRIVIADVDGKLVDAVRASKGTYHVNVAYADGIKVLKIDGIEMLNPAVDSDRKVLLTALSEATEIVTSLPSVKFFDNGTDTSVAALIAAGLKTNPGKTIIYTAENNNHAAEILHEAVTARTAVDSGRVQFLNTVIGKMSQVVTDPAVIERMKLTRISPGFDRAFLVEAFNKILVTRTNLAGFKPGIRVFIEKDDLLPYEEAKLYGHNAIHALLAYLGLRLGLIYMTELKNDRQVMQIARDAFIKESGGALVKKYARLNDELFTVPGYRAYAADLLDRMTNPNLYDTVERAGRDPIRKLAPEDRIFGTMSLALDHGIEPVNMAAGALAGVKTLLKDAQKNNLPPELHYNPAKLDAAAVAAILNWLWTGKKVPHAQPLVRLVQQSLPGI